ncbi:MAG: hypothetical protein PHC90_12210 [Syntrophorhabdaceae bacterium]|nr:hypothetical protein [Syntrophorhabdaceae bacterium]
MLHLEVLVRKLHHRHDHSIQGVDDAVASDNTVNLITDKVGIALYPFIIFSDESKRLLQDGYFHLLVHANP